MSPARLLPLGVLLAASSLSAQYVTLSGAGGVAGESYSDALNTGAAGSFTELRLGFLFDYLVVGGGGAGGTGGGSGGENTWGAGGGGAGGVISGQTELYAWDVGTAYGTINVMVGTGGAAAAYSAGSTTNGASGTSSLFATANETLTALGGGGGAGSNNSATGGVGLNGGSGGGGGGDGLRAGGSGTAGQGFGGGTSRTSAGNRSAGGGGGGAGGVGQIGGPPLGHSSGVGGNGGVGVANSITGTSVTYGGGGGGGGRDTNSGATSAGGTGGTGGGGAGSGQGNATSGTDGLGGGGGGSGSDGKGGDGGDGIVIIRYKGAAAGTGGTVAAGTGTAAGYTLHTFNAIAGGGQLQVLDLSATDVSSRLGSVVSSAVTGSGALSINTVGTIVYTGTASHTGGTAVQAGTLKLGNGGTSGSLGGDVFVASGATVEYNRSGNASFSSLSGAGAVVKKGTGRLTVSEGSGFSGSLSLEAGSVALGASGALGSAAVTLAGGSLASDGASARSLGNAIALAANTTLGNATNNGELTLSGGVNLGNATRVLTLNSDVTLSGAVAGGNLTKVGSGALTLSGDNSAFSGDITLGVLSGAQGGALRVGSANALGTGSIVLRNTGGAISSDGASARTLANNFVFADTGYSLTLGDASRSGALTLTGNLDLGARASILTVLSDVTHTGTLGNPSLAFTKDGAGTLTLAGDNSGFAPAYWFSINEGKVRIGSADALGTARLSLRDSALTSVGSTARVIGQETYFQGDMTLGDATDNGALTFADNVSFASGTRTLTVESDVAILGSIRDGNLVKAGAGKLTLSGYSIALTPSVTVSQGKLVLNGTLGAASTVTVGQNGTLGGSGTILGNATISGVHTPGNSPGIQTFGGNLTYDAGSMIVWELGADTVSNTPSVLFDQIVVGGDLDFAAQTVLDLSFDPVSFAGTVDWSSVFWLSSHSWTILDVAGTTTGFENLLLNTQNPWLDAQGDAFGDFLAGGSFSLSQVGNDIVLNYTAAIPEPSTYGLILGGLALAGAAIRRRRAGKNSK